VEKSSIGCRPNSVFRQKNYYKFPCIEAIKTSQAQPISLKNLPRFKRM